MTNVILLGRSGSGILTGSGKIPSLHTALTSGEYFYFRGYFLKRETSKKIGYGIVSPSALQAQGKVALS